MSKDVNAGSLGPPLQDPLTMASKRLGEAKTVANKRGMSMLDAFEEIRTTINDLKEHGLSISTVQFENTAIQAAWREYTQGEWISDIPLMAHEDTIVRRIRTK